MKKTRVFKLQTNQNCLTVDTIIEELIFIGLHALRRFKDYIIKTTESEKQNRSQ